MRPPSPAWWIGGAVLIAACGLYGEETPVIEAPPPSGDAGMDAADAAGDVAVDPLRCTAPVERCAPGAPEGWKGPFSLYRGNPSNAPTCPANAPLKVVDASEGLVKGPFSCGACTCTPPTGVACPATGGGIQGFTLDGCAAGLGLPCSAGTFPPNSCSAIASEGCPGGVAPKSFQYTHPGPPTGGACAAPTGGAPVRADDVHWTGKIIGCGVEIAPPKDCAEGSRCRPIARVPFETRLCIVKSADEACPGAPYSERETLAYEKLDNTRACSACVCNLNRGQCDAAFRVYGSADLTCATPGPARTFSSSICDDIDSGGVPYRLGYTITHLGAVCSVGGGLPTGDAVPKDAVTICCEP
jgi:hypothetical protein